MDDAIGAVRHATGRASARKKQHMSRAKARAAFTNSRKATTNAMCTVKKQMGTPDVCILEIIRKDVRGEDSNTKRDAMTIPSARLTPAEIIDRCTTIMTELRRVSRSRAAKRAIKLKPRNQDEVNRVDKRRKQHSWNSGAQLKFGSRVMDA